MKQYIDLCNRIIKEGHWVENERTGKRCLTVINADLEYDVGKGEFPLLTTRKSYWKSAIAEMLGYIRGYDNAADFRKVGTKTWDANANADIWQDNPFCKNVDDMGLAYRFRKQGYYLETPNFKEYVDTTVFKLRICDDIPTIDCGIIGQVYDSVSSGQFKITAFVGQSEDKRVKYYNIQFLETGYIKTIQKSQLKKCNIKDPYAISICGVARIGNIDKPTYHPLFKTWSHIIERCYNKDCAAYPIYGGRGVKVSNDWLTFENFVKDFKSLTNWELKSVFPKEYSLDKDWCLSSIYSKHTCRWSTRKEQAQNTSNVHTYKIIDEDGIIQYAKSLEHLSNIVNYSPKKLSGILNSGCTANINGFSISITTDVHITYVEVDQLKTIYAKLKLGIDDRRLIMDAHNPHLNEYTSLPACMYSHHFSILDGTLYLNSTQRSCDVPLGLAFNMPQCYFLLAVMAKITGLKAGKVYHKIVNAHIYEDQLELMKEQVKREVLPSPTFSICDEVETLEDLETWFNVSNCKLTGYQCHDAIKYPFSV